MLYYYKNQILIVIQIVATFARTREYVRSPVSGVYYDFPSAMSF